MKRRLSILLAALLVSSMLWSVQAACRAGEEATGGKAEQCRATIPVENPWTKNCPQGWWKQRHESILSAPERGECEIVFIGDSITHAWETTGKKVWDREYAPLKALNLGVNCDCTEHVLWRLDHGEADGLPKLKVAVVMIGINNTGLKRDKPEDIAAGIEAICGRLKQRAPKAKILLLAIFPFGRGRANNEKVNEAIAKFGDNQRIFFLNINDGFLAPDGTLLKDVMQDRLHPNEKGYEAWAETIRPTVKKLMQ